MYLENSIRKALPGAPALASITFSVILLIILDIAGCYFGRILVRSSDTVPLRRFFFFGAAVCVCVCIADEFVSKRVLMDGCLAVQRLLGGRLSRCLPSFLPSFLPGLLILIYLALRRWEAFAFFFFFSSPPRLS